MLYRIELRRLLVSYKRGSMDTARNVFETIRSFKTTGQTAKTPDEQFLEYVNNILGSVERVHVEFKQKYDSRNSKLDISDKRNLAKAVSGFANSSGGVLIWGIEDKTLIPKPITNIQEFVAALAQLSIQVTDPIVQNIDVEWIQSSDPANDQGFGLLFVPESLLPPHRAILSDKEVQNNYYIRSGDSFVEASHTQLEDMFGRRPKPDLYLSITFRYGGGSERERILYVMIGIENHGRAVAKYPFLSIKVLAPYKVSDYGIDGNMHFGLPKITNSIRSEEFKYGASSECVIHSGVTQDVTCVEVKIDPRKSLHDVHNLEINYKIAAEGVKILEGHKEITGQELYEEAKKQYEEAIRQ
jgi:hypothetical protein